MTAAAYRAAGGFPPLTVGEDRALVEAAVAAGLRVVRATDLPVTTECPAECAGTWRLQRVPPRSARVTGG